MTKTQPAPLPMDTQVGLYRIEQLLAVGGFGLVYRARDPQGRAVAIKEYLPSTLCTRAPGQCQPQVRPECQALYRLGLRSFFEEGRALARIAHPAVVGVQNFVHAHGTVYLVMDYLQGASLQDYIIWARQRRQPHTLREGAIRTLLDQLLRGLRIVHQHGLLHLDIKPANILITDDDRAVLIDFGAARQVLQREGASWVKPMFTPGFAAPEMQRRDGAAWLGPWTDLYAVGACLYAAMVGSPPPEAPQRQQDDRVPATLQALRSVYSEVLREAARWCMMLDPAQRPPSVFALQQALAFRDEAQDASSGKWVSRLLGMLRRRRSGGGVSDRLSSQSP